MFKCLAVVVALEMTLCAAVLAKSGGPGKVVGIPEGGGSQPIRLDAGGKNPDTIRGTCTLIESDAGSLSSPCVDLQLVLTDEQGNEIERARTSSKGTFKFSANRKKTYLIDTASDDYEILSPTSTVKGGETVDLEVQQKPDDKE